MSARDDYRMLAMLTEAEFPTRRDLIERDLALDEIDGLRSRDAGRLRYRCLAQDRARLARAAQRLVDACTEDDDCASGYVDALNALSAMLQLGGVAGPSTYGAGSADPDVVGEVARQLRSIAADLRTAGDVALVNLRPDGVAPAGITLADELWMYALQLDGRMSNEDE